MKTTVSVFNLQYEDLKDIRCPLRDIVVEEHRSAEERIQAAAEKKAAEEIVTKIENETIEACAMTFINMNDGNQIFGHGITFKNEKTKTFYEKFVLLDEAQIISLCITTKRQSGSKEWFECRKVRITGSMKAHQILRLRKKNDCKFGQ